MSGIRLYIVFWLILVITIYCGECCGPAEIGQPYTITSPASVTPGSRVSWQISTGALLYDSDRTQSNYYPGYVGSREQLTIKNVIKNDGTVTFQHSVDWDSVYTCALPVYNRASIPTCESVTLIEKQIRTTCTTAQVYPKAKCQFTLLNEGKGGRDITDGTPYITYTHTDPQTDPQTGGNEYYSTSCTLQYPVDGLKPGHWTVQVNMYPDLTGVSLAQGTIGQTDNTLLLSVPTVNIDPNNCPKGLAGEGNTNVKHSYIRHGERASCECARSYAGNPPGTIDWTSTQEGSFDMLSQSEDGATIQINLHDTFTCWSTSVLDGSYSATYIPKIAYGPSSASLTFQRPGPIYLCPNQQTNIDITCQVPANSISPAILFTINRNNNYYLVTKVAGDDVWNKSVNYNFTIPGTHTFTCRVENAIFIDIVSESPVKAIHVYAPPNSPPSLEVTGQSLITDNTGTWIKQGSDIAVSCSAGVAYPLVSSVTVTCGQEASSNGQLSVSSVMENELKCQCAAVHETETSCNGLNLNDELTIQTAYGPNEITVSFADDQLREVPDTPLNLCSSDGLDVTVICVVKQSDVRPGLTLYDFTLTTSNKINNQQTFLDTSREEYYRSVNKLKITAGGNHNLVCEARNPKFSNIKQAQFITIEVREPPTKPPKIFARSSQHGDVLVEGDDVTVACDVSGGYPSVHSVTLTCGLYKSVTSNGTSAELTLNRIELTCNVINCKCQATHITGCYDLMGNLPLTVVSNNMTKVREHGENTVNLTKAELAGIVAGTAVVMLVLEAFIALIIFSIRRGKAARKNRNSDTGYDTIGRLPTQPYQNIRPHDPNYLTINPPDQALGSNSESANQETDRTYRNEIFDEYTEPTEPDPNAYSEIQMN